MLLDLSQDYRSLDNVESVTYTSARLTGPQVDGMLVKRRALSVRDLAGGVYTPGDVPFLIFAPEFRSIDVDQDPDDASGSGPKPSDILTDVDGVDWTILDVTGGKRDGAGRYQTWRVVCRDLVLAYDLRDTIDIQLPGITYDGTGAKLKSWPDDLVPGGKVLYPALAARVQEEGRSVGDFSGIRDMLVTYQITVGRQVTLSGEERIKWVPTRLGQTTPLYLNIESVSKPQQIGELPVLSGKRNP